MEPFDFTTFDFINRSNAEYIELLYHKYQTDPRSVDTHWRAFFAGFEAGGGRQISSVDGNSALWVKMTDLEMSPAALAVLGDYVPFGIAQALGRWTRANSLDNTLRIVDVVSTEWVLLDIRVHGVRDGFGHGLVHLWAEDGTLLGTASQSTIVRVHEPVDDEPLTELEGSVDREAGTQPGADPKARGRSRMDMGG